MNRLLLSLAALSILAACDPTGGDGMVDGEPAEITVSLDEGATIPEWNSNTDAYIPFHGGASYGMLRAEHGNGECIDVWIVYRDGLWGVESFGC